MRCVGWLSACVRACACMGVRVRAHAWARSGEQRSFARLSELMSEDLPTCVVHTPTSGLECGRCSVVRAPREYEGVRVQGVPPYAVEYRGGRVLSERAGKQENAVLASRRADVGVANHADGDGRL